MRFISVAERELRAGARQPMTYRMRWTTAAAFIGLLIWLMWAFDGFRAPQIFCAFSAIAFFYCLFIGTARTADCLSAEKREGTMGLLFLTNLNAAEVMGGKLCSSALAAAYGLFAIFPLLALQMLIGGITLAHFWRTLLALGDCIIFSVAAGFLTSSICIKQFAAIASATGLALFVSVGLVWVAAALNALSAAKVAPLFLRALRAGSPLYTFIAADGTRWFGSNDYWWSVLLVNGISVLFLAIATWQVSRSWRDRESSSSTWRVFKILRREGRSRSLGRVALRRRLLGINPYYWLGGRERVSGPVLMIVVVAIVAAASFVGGPYFGRAMRLGPMSAMVGHLFAWFWAGLAIHALVLYWAAMTAAQRLAEDKQAGAFELVLSTPTSERSIFRGLWMAYGRKMFFPAIIVILVHGFVMWQGASLLLMDTSGFPPGATAGQLLWHTLINHPLGGAEIEWSFISAFRIMLAALVLACLLWITLGWVGRWLGLRMKHPGFAPMVSLGLCIVPPIVLFSIASYVAFKIHLDRLPDRVFVSLMTWVAFGIGTGHCLMLSLWATGQLRTEFRTIVTSRFQPKPLHPWWRPSRQTVIRLGVAGFSGATLLTTLICGFYGYQNWRSQRDWTVFQKQLQQRKESLNLAAFLPAPVAPNQNFALNSIFRNLIDSSRTTNSFKRLVQIISPVNVQVAVSANSVGGSEWYAQDFSLLDVYAGWTSPTAKFKQRATREDFAAAILKGLEPQAETLRTVTEAARLPYFQITTNYNSDTIFQTQAAGMVLERLHMLFQIRSCALLASGRLHEAAEDLTTGLELVRLARQTTDPGAPGRVQLMVTRSLQPIWEGIVDHRWSEPQLAAFQNDLSQFNLLADYTNAVRRVVLAYSEKWQRLASGKPDSTQIPQARYNEDRPVWLTQNRAWWLDNCIQLYKAGEIAIQNVDAAGGHVKFGQRYPDVSGLPVDGDTSSMIQQYSWLGPFPVSPVFAQTSLNQGIIACALERFRLAHGKYPEALNELVPQYLPSMPTDVVRGRAMLYENSGDGRYILRGVGPNEIDDRKNKISDDWLWAFPTNAPPAAASPK
jgi:hypothetical protein